MEPAQVRQPELRLFDSTDLPQHRGDFTSQHTIMVRSRQFAEIAGLMDGAPGDQPTLKRFSRYNQSMHTRPTTASVFDPTSSQSQQPQTYSKGGKLKTGIFSGNWTLRNKKDIRPSVHNITIVPIGKQSPSCSNLVSTPSSSSLHVSVATRRPTQSSDRHTDNSDRGTPVIRREQIMPYPSRCGTPFGCCDNKTIPPPLSDEHNDRRELFMRSSNDCREEHLNNRERLIPIEVQRQKDKNHFFDDPPTLKSRNIIVNVTEDRRGTPFDANQRYPSPLRNSRETPIMRIKKNESCEDVIEGINIRQYSQNSERIGIDQHRNEGDCTDDVLDYDDGFIQRISNNNATEGSRSGLMRRFGGVKSMGPTRRQWHRPVLEVFPTVHVRSISKDSGMPTTPSDKYYSNCSSCTDERSPTPPSLNDNFTTHLVIDADSAYRTGSSDSSPSSASSNADGHSTMMRKSCPDLRQPLGALSKNLEAHHVQNQRNRRAREKKEAALWMKKPLLQWTLDDVLLWLQHCKLDDVASIMIGYDMTGSDLDKWDDDILAQLGVSDAGVRNEVLSQLRAIKSLQAAKTENEQLSDKPFKNKSRVPLFKLVRSASYDKVLALETCLTTRDITVAEGRFGCLQVTKVNGANIPLKEQDCLLEINDKPGQAFRSPLMFTKIVSEAAGEPIRLVVLRRRPYFDEDDEDQDQSNGDPYRTLRATEQDSSASSGVSSSEISSDVVPLSPSEDKKSQVLRF